MTAAGQKVGILHYSAPPVIGGVESVILAHTRLLVEAGYRTTVIAGRGDARALPKGAKLIRIPEMDSQHPQVLGELLAPGILGEQTRAVGRPEHVLGLPVVLPALLDLVRERRRVAILGRVLGHIRYEASWGPWAGSADNVSIPSGP